MNVIGLMLSLDDSNEPKARAEPVKARGKHVGRNEPCPCGSGKKFKKCHLVDSNGFNLVGATTHRTVCDESNIGYDLP